MNLKNRSKVIVGIFLISMFLWSCGNKKTSGFYVKSVANPVVNINGIWYINTNPEKEFWKQSEINTANWKKIQVPGELMMQGFLIKNDEPFAYKNKLYL